MFIMKYFFLFATVSVITEIVSVSSTPLCSLVIQTVPEKMELNRQRLIKKDFCKIISSTPMLTPQTLELRAKFMKQCQEIKQYWTGQENFEICFCVICDH